MSAPKTVKTEASVSDYINSVAHPIRKENSLQLLSIMKTITGVKPCLWGDQIIGFDEYHYRYASGREGDWPMLGFSPRKHNLSIYIMPGFKIMQDLLEKLGKHKTSVSCLYINTLADVDLNVLKEIIRRSYTIMKEKHH